MDRASTLMCTGNIHVNLDENDLKKVLDQFGPTESIKIHRDNLGNSKGFAFVKYFRSDSASLAMTSLAGMELAGTFIQFSLCVSLLAIPYSGRYSLPKDGL
jgi:RNA recognition motif-containing protein